METEIIAQNGRKIAVIAGDQKRIADVQSALDLIMDTKYRADTNLLAIDKEAVAEEFFILSSGLAGEVLQKFINYHVKVAFFGDFSAYTSKPLKDFMYESNKGRDVYFVSSRAEAVDRLADVEA